MTIPSEHSKCKCVLPREAFAIPVCADTNEAMKRKWNSPLWVGFLCALAGLVTYPFFVQFRVTRDVPWANFLLLGLGIVLLLVGLFRAFGRPQVYRGKIFGSIFTLLGLCAAGFFSYIVFFVLKDLPASTSAPHIGQRAPEFTLPDQDGHPVALADLLTTGRASGEPGAALLIFYRGFW